MQLDLLDAPALPAEPLAERLYRLGLPRDMPVTLTNNRVTLMSWRPRTGLRLHGGYAAAPDAILRAMVRFLSRRVPRAERAAARRIFIAFPVDRHVPSRAPRPRRPRAASPTDIPLLERLVAAQQGFNVAHFGGGLPTIPIRISDRMRARLGELRATPDGRAVEISISRRHIRRDRWDAVLETLLHEMVHQWQTEEGHRLDHGREFRRKAREVGIHPRAVADLRRSA